MKRIPIVVGVDPGVSGGVAFVRLDAKGKPKLLAHTRTPQRKMRSATLVDSAALKVWYGDTMRKTPGDVAEWCIEMVGAMPGQGVSSMFNFGRSLGAVEALAETLCSSVCYAPPPAWKKHFGYEKGLKDGAKDRASLAMARQHFPRQFISTVLRDAGRADAAMIGLWRLQTYWGLE